MRKLATVLPLALVLGFVHARADDSPVSHAALHLAVHDVGISFGNAPIVHGLRFNWKDRELQRVDGFDFTIVGSENPKADIHGIGVLLLASDFSFSWVHEMAGLGLSVSNMGAQRSRGAMVGVGLVSAEDAKGIQVGGVGVNSGRSTGIQVGGLITAGGPMSGLTVAGLMCWSQGLDVTGINVGGLGVWGKNVGGLNVGGVMVLGDERVTGISLSSLVAADERVAGVSFAALILRTKDLTGVSVAGLNRVEGIQRGVTIGLLNNTRDLHGVQIGIINIAGNNRGVLRALPMLNAHFGQ